MEVLTMVLKRRCQYTDLNYENCIIFCLVIGVWLAVAIIVGKLT